MWVLILTVWAGFNSPEIEIHALEFETSETCHHARNEWINATNFKKYSAVCVKK